MMRKFKCQDCQHEFEVPYGEGGRGVDMTCPECGSQNVYRVREGLLTGAMAWGQRGWSRGFGRGRGGGGRRRGWWGDPEATQTETNMKDGEQG